MKRALLVVTLVAAFGAGCKKSEPADSANTEAKTGGKTGTTNGADEPKVVETATGSAPGSAAIATGSAAPTSADPWSKPPAAKDPLPRPFLWSVEKDGTTSYLLGTIHQGVDAESRLPPIVFEKLDGARAFAMETDLGSATESMKDMIQCVGCSLKKELTPAEYGNLERVLGQATVAQIQGLKPMVAATMVSLSFMPQTAPMDGILQGRAKRLNKPIIYLEKAEDAAKVLEKWMDVRALKLMLVDIDGAKKQMDDMLASYIAGDADKLLAINESEKEKTLKVYSQAEYDQQQTDMLYNRNAAWLPAIEKMHAEGGGFVAVGTLHLVGPKSVPDLLEKKGYKITRIAP